MGKTKAIGQTISKPVQGGAKTIANHPEPVAKKAQSSVAKAPSSTVSKGEEQTGISRATSQSHPGGGKKDCGNAWGTYINEVCDFLDGVSKTAPQAPKYI